MSTCEYARNATRATDKVNAIPPHKNQKVYRSESPVATPRRATMLRKGSARKTQGHNFIQK